MHVSDDPRERWQDGIVTPAEEAALHDQGIISDCEYEFGPHDDHSDCDRMLDYMNHGADDAYEASIDYSDWYGGERGYQDGLRWDDFI